MGIKIYTISLFRDDIKNLTKRKNLGYSTVLDDINSFINYHNTFEKLWNQPKKLSESGISRLIKVRVENSGLKRGKSSSFRLYYIANKEKKEVCLLHIYPKVGKLRKSNVGEKELQRIKNIFINELKTKKLIDLNEAFPQT